jgi:hypothetical protein
VIWARDSGSGRSPDGGRLGWVVLCGGFDRGDGDVLAESFEL